MCCWSKTSRRIRLLEQDVTTFTHPLRLLLLVFRNFSWFTLYRCVTKTNLNLNKKTNLRKEIKATKKETRRSVAKPRENTVDNVSSDHTFWLAADRDIWQDCGVLVCIVLFIRWSYIRGSFDSAVSCIGGKKKILTFSVEFRFRNKVHLRVQLLKWRSYKIKKSAVESNT